MRSSSDVLDDVDRWSIQHVLVLYMTELRISTKLRVERHRNLRRAAHGNVADRNRALLGKNASDDPNSGGGLLFSTNCRVVVKFWISKRLSL
ncbi:hypothetical protein MRB53_025360 [Persea americana]|uniref:Uncharacterized protein n=1 Tax=Persea americana TaxID=3435 RepID=A0ACC2LG72_PERAE|nr:hypothetical protein MRB53_025360 [Persea americana]